MGFRPWFHLPGFHFGTGFLSHSHLLPHSSVSKPRTHKSGQHIPCVVSLKGRGLSTKTRGLSNVRMLILESATFIDSNSPMNKSCSNTKCPLSILIPFEGDPLSRGPVGYAPVGYALQMNVEPPLGSFWEMDPHFGFLPLVCLVAPSHPLSFLPFSV